MKSITALALTTVLFLSSAMVFGQTAPAAGKEQEKTLDESLKDIRQGQGVSQIQSIDCNKVTNRQFEELGDAFMSVVHPNRQVHEFMDRMMGGEGSQSLAYMHRMMGARYLGCYNSDYYGQWYGMSNMMGYGPGYGYGMMGNGVRYGVMGPGMMRYWSDPQDYDNTKTIERRTAMIGYGYYPMMGFGMGWFMWIFWILVIVLIYLLLRAGAKGGDSSSGEKPLGILKKRYAKGEISKEEFERMKKDLEA